MATLARQVRAAGVVSASRIHRARVCGRGKPKKRRARLGVVAVGEVGLEAVGLEDERQLAVVQAFARGRREAGGVHGALPLDTGERRAGRLGLDDADDLLVEVEGVVRPAVAGRHDHLTDRAGDERVQVFAVHDGPTRPLQLPVDLDPGTLLRSQGRVGAHARTLLSLPAYGGETELAPLEVGAAPTRACPPVGAGAATVRKLGGGHCFRRRSSTPSGVEEREDELVVDRALAGDQEHPRLLDQPSRASDREKLEPRPIGRDLHGGAWVQAEGVTQRLRHDNASQGVNHGLHGSISTSRFAAAPLIARGPVELTGACGSGSRVWLRS